jgi:hypothetical protein
VEPNNVEEESVCHHCCRIRVAEGDEMSVLRERVHHSVDHILVAHLGKPSMKSMVTSDHTADGTSSSCSNPTGWRCSVLFCWHVA